MCYIDGMWLFTKFGFFSVVESDANTLTVRSRSVGDLESLIDHHGSVLCLTKSNIKSSPLSDYRYRVFVPKEKWSVTLSQIASDIDYKSFKDKVFDDMDAPRADSYHDVWEVMYNLQRSEEKKKEA